MKSNLTKAIGAGIFALGMTMLPLTLPVQAQSNGGTTNTTPDTTTTTAPTTTTYERDDFDWGWLGLIGLLGLGGLAGKNRRDDATRYRDPNAVGTSTTYRE
ncbi:hypothetical protein H6G81_20335 [Scytonema hofmannii FACHB-248]|uniref:WGxxGxxG-CTERM domain-containing protein n=1 Tax=Scytonema hofmannii FACHB-248 TaxID=1842502 RepID=A0ABR8GTJ7_9CYAN|nr:MULTISPECIES: WGxxGxxG family protein [Nostocales]MBD2606814.1 hypothetical protein [Scytonema hofmannii FACHB-248]